MDGVPSPGAASRHQSSTESESGSWGGAWRGEEGGAGREPPREEAQLQ